jgi:hypothetical protein
LLNQVIRRHEARGIIVGAHVVGIETRHATIDQDVRRLQAFEGGAAALSGRNDQSVDLPRYQELDIGEFFRRILTAVGDE